MISTLKPFEFEIKRDNVIVGAGHSNKDGSLEVYLEGKTANYSSMEELKSFLLNDCAVFNCNGNSKHQNYL